MLDNETIRQKKENVKATFARQPHDRVPLLGRIGTAVLDYYGYTYAELSDDPEKFNAVIGRFFEDLPSDCLSSGTLYLSPDLSGLLGDNIQTKVAPDGVTLQHQQKPFMVPEDYPAAIEDLQSLNKELFKRKFPNLFNTDVKTAAKTLEEVSYLQRKPAAGMDGSTARMLEEQYGQTVFGDRRFMCSTPGDVIFDSYRGFTGTLSDMRRYKTQIREMCDMLWEKRYVNHFDNVTMSPDKFALYMSHIPCFLSPKQYEDLCFKYFKPVVENIAAAGSKLYILAEGSWGHLFDFFLDLPKDSVVMNVENDDVWDAYAAIGSHQLLIGGMKLAMTKLNSLEDNLAYVKKAIDTCAPGNGFIFGSDKSWCCKGDITPTLFEVYKFAAEYGKYNK